MSLLHQNSEEVDDAALGEELTKGSSHLVWASVIAAVVVSAAIAIYVLAGQKPQAATGEIEQVWVHPQHTETSGFDANGVPMPKEVYDQIYVFALVKIHNQAKEPLFLHSIMTDATLDDGIHTAYDASASDYERLFTAYPNLPVPHGKPLSPQVTIQPGDTVEGTIVAAFRLTKEQWDAHKDLSFTFAIQYQPNLKLTPHTPIQNM
ncbi:MAG TPA: hypothetical protein VGG15_11545 [Terriglobales bacterium]|jgi:hypothetical protein